MTTSVPQSNGLRQALRQLDEALRPRTDRDPVNTSPPVAPVHAAPAPAPVEYVVPRVKLHDLTQELMRAKGLSYGAAFRQVQRTYPMLADEYATELHTQH